MFDYIMFNMVRLGNLEVNSDVYAIFGIFFRMFLLLLSTWIPCEFSQLVGICHLLCELYIV